jgi:murein DD-endopeptidase MepM/ murein hydrolase activator NlpD
MSNFQRPTKTTKISDDFNDHKKRGSKNPGTDYVVGVGTPVFAIGDGTVCKTVTSISGAGGRMVWLDLADGGFADYLHLSRIDVKAGQKVTKGQQLGLSGASGLGKENGYGAHLHFSFSTNHSHTTASGNVDFEALLGGKAAPAAPASSGGRATLKKGSKGADVKYLQGKLGITADGDFGPNTHKAVVAFQASKGLEADGIVGPKTWAAIG